MTQNFNLGAYGDPGGSQALGNFRNKLINGAMDVWQRGLSFTINNYAQYTADRWYSGSGTGGVATISRNLHAAVSELYGTFYFQHMQTTAATVAPWLTQRIEGVRTFAGKSITVSLATTVYTNPITITVIGRQNFGTGGSPSATVDTTLGTITLGTVYSLYTPTVTGTMPSIAGKTLGTNGDDFMEIIFLLPTGIQFTWNVWNIQAEEGVYQTPFEIRPKGIEKFLCQRYFTTSFPEGTSPGHNKGSTGALSSLHMGVNNSAAMGSLQYITNYPAEMRRTPTVTTYSVGNLTTGKWNYGGSAVAANDVTTALHTGSDARKLHMIGYGDSVNALAMGSGMHLHFTADAEL